MAPIDNNETKELCLVNTPERLLTDRAYNTLIGLTVLCGLAVNAVMVAVIPQDVVNVVAGYPWAMFIGFLVVAIGSIVVIHKSDSLILSFTGFMALSMAFGVMVAFAVNAYTPVSVQRAFTMTAAVAGLMTLAAVVFPGAFLRLGRALFTGLVAVLVVEIAFTLAAGSHSVVFDWVFVAIFSLYIAFDWRCAQVYPHTAGNAIDAAADIYMDIVNLFLRILSIVGQLSR